jgi:hypothetical protein
MKCRVCGCSEFDPCPGGCAWAPGGGDICTVCFAAAEAIREWMEETRRVNWAALRREVLPQLAKGASS